MAEPKTKAAPGRRGLINLRMSPDDRSVIDRAAKSAGKTRTQFMVEAARRAAHDTLLDTTFMLVDGKSFRQFRDLFDAPPQPNEGLRRLMSLRPPWDA